MESRELSCCVYPALEVLRRAVKAQSERDSPLRCEMELYRMFFAGLPCRRDCGRAEWAICSAAMMRKFKKKAEEFEGADSVDWIMCRGLEELMKQCKSEVNQICYFLLMNNGSNLSYTCKSSQLDSQALPLKSFIKLIPKSARNLQYYCYDLISPMKKQVISIGDTFEMFKSFVDLASPSLPGEFISHTRAWASPISHLLCLYWTFEVYDGSLAASTGIMLSGLMQKHMPCTPQVIALHLDLLMKCEQVSWPRVDLFLEPYNKLLLSFGMEILHEGLLFLSSFFLDLVTKEPEHNGLEETKAILAEIYDILITEVPSVIGIPNPNSNLSTFFHRTDMVKTKVRDLYAVTPLKPQLELPRDSVPRAEGMWSVDPFLTNLQEMLNEKTYDIPSINNTMVSVKDDLASLCEFIQGKLDLKKEQKELRAIWTQAVRVTYFAGHVAYYCFRNTKSVWFGILCLPALIEDVKLLKSKVREIGVNYDAFLPEAPASSIIGKFFICFNEEEERIFSALFYGTHPVIISILGMGGQGKTSLAKRIYNHPSVHYHFSKKVWCSVSGQCNPETLLVKISHDLGSNVDVKIDGAIEHISLSLKGKRYLIVLDDVWDVDLWKVLQSSLPNDKNGSRVIFTSRNADMVQQAMSAYHAESEPISVRLRFLTDEESWEVMEKNVFDCDECPPDLIKIGKKIASSCKGLPLAVVLAASILQKRDKLLEVWEKVATNLPSHLASEGFTDIMALSYKHLPDYLKPCFLYFASFGRGQNISVTKLEHLWMAERFGKKVVPYVELIYLEELISHSLVIVEFGYYKMKSCKVHELLYDVCREIAVQDTFVHLVDGYSILGECYSNSQKYEFQLEHRLCIHQAGSFTPSQSICTRKHPTRSQVHSILLSGFHFDTRQCLSSFLGRFKSLTILDLEDLCMSGFPQVILHNKHLRYLALRGLIDHIPPSIGDLHNLETIIVKRRSLLVVGLPDTLWAKGNLKYVDIDRMCVPSQIDESCGKKIKVLCGIVVEYGALVEEFMRRLTELEKLKCYCINGELDPMWFEFCSLICLHVRGWSSLMLPNQSLPAWDFPKHLKKLVLEDCRLPWSVMLTVGNLPDLKFLKLSKRACVGTTWYLGDGEFKYLECLELCDLDLERIDDSASGKPPFLWLRRLFLLRCLGLEDFPTCFSRSFIVLETMDISGSPVSSESMKPFLKNNESVRIFGLEE